MRQLSFFDKLLNEIDQAAQTVFNRQPNHQRKNPADNEDTPELDDRQRRHVAGLMRVDHTGEVCAQALYRGQAFVAKTDTTRYHLLQAANEEQDHLAWCQHRLDELGSRTSYLNPLWYLGSFAIGGAAGLISDKISYGFVNETENQVMTHLDGHLKSLPYQDVKSRAIIKQMYLDESEHATNALNAGGQKLSLPIRCMMKCQSKVMTTTTYWL
jgi:ubiquinone biosynthesis monooxygenase Coq7